MQKSKVFVTQEMPRLDYTPAQKFGEIVFIVRQDYSPVAGSLINESINQAIAEKLRNFDFENDYLVFSGSPTVAAAVFAFIGRKGQRPFCVLRWSNRDCIYIPIHITV